jgi:hypothetical protein
MGQPTFSTQLRVLEPVYAFMSKFTELEKKKDEEEVILTNLRHQVLEKEQRVNQMLEELTVMAVEGATMLKTLPPHLRAFVEGDSRSPTTLDADDADDTNRVYVHVGDSVLPASPTDAYYCGCLQCEDKHDVLHPVIAFPKNTQGIHITKQHPTPCDRTTSLPTPCGRTTSLPTTSPPPAQASDVEPAPPPQIIVTPPTPEAPKAPKAPKASKTPMAPKAPKTDKACKQCMRVLPITEYESNGVNKWKPKCKTCMKNATLTHAPGHKETQNDEGSSTDQNTASVVRGSAVTVVSSNGDPPPS